MKWAKEHIKIHDGYVIVEGLGTVGHWWKQYDKKVSLSYGFGESFIAKTENEVIDRILEILIQHETR